MQVTVVEWKPDVKNTRQGYAIFYFKEIGLYLKDCAVHKLGPDRGNKVFVAFPAKEYTTTTGSKKYWNFVHFDRERTEEFQRDAVNALRTYLKALRAAPPPPSDNGSKTPGSKDEEPL